MSETASAVTNIVALLVSGTVLIWNGIDLLPVELMWVRVIALVVGVVAIGTAAAMLATIKEVER